jgi:hypothetical protein
MAPSAVLSKPPRGVTGFDAQGWALLADELPLSRQAEDPRLGVWPDTGPAMHANDATPPASC